MEFLKGKLVNSDYLIFKLFIILLVCKLFKNFPGLDILDISNFLGGNILILDPIMTIVISLFILKVSIDIFKDGINELIDKAAPDDFLENIHEDILNYPGVLAINDLKSRMFGSKIYIELEIAVLDTLSVREGHDIAKGVHDMLEGKYDNIKHCIVHIDPYSISIEENEK